MVPTQSLFSMGFDSIFIVVEDILRFSRPVNSTLIEANRAEEKLLKPLLPHEVTVWSTSNSNLLELHYICSCFDHGKI